MNTNRIIFFVLLLLAGAAVYVYLQDDQTTLKEDLSNFAVADTSTVNKIFLANRDGQEILLERTAKNDWTVNGEFPARMDLVQVLLRTINKVEVKAPIAKNAHNTIVRLLAGEATKVEIYQNNDLAKTYYVGSSAMNNMGTYMLLENSATPYITHIPGFYGYLTPRYTTLLHEWRTTRICDLRVSEIQSMSLDYHDMPTNSFRIDRNGKQLRFSQPSPDATIVNYDSVEIRRYLLNFRQLNFESFELRKVNEDSVFSSPKFFTMEVKDNTGKKTSIEAWRMAPTIQEEELEMNEMRYDVDRMYARINGVNELVFIQYFVFDRLLVTPLKFEIDPTLRRDK